MKFCKKLILILVVFEAIVTVHADTDRRQTSDVVDIEVPVTPPLKSDVERQLWRALAEAPPSQLDMVVPKDIPHSDLIDILGGWLKVDEVERSTVTRQLLYQFIANTSLRQGQDGIRLLIAGMNDREVPIRNLCAGALVDGDIPLLTEVDFAFSTYLNSDMTTVDERAVLLKRLATRQGKIGAEVLSLIEKQVVVGPTSKMEDFWGACLLIQTKGATVLPELFGALRNSEKLEEVFRAMYVFSGSSGGSFNTTPDVRLDIQTAFIKLLQDSNPDIRRVAIRNVFAQLGPTPYSSSKEQLEVNLRVMSAISEMKGRETEPEILKHIEEYVLPAFESSGTLKPKSQWRKDVADMRK